MGVMLNWLQNCNWRKNVGLWCGWFCCGIGNDDDDGAAATACIGFKSSNGYKWPSRSKPVLC